MVINLVNLKMTYSWRREIILPQFDSASMCCSQLTSHDLEGCIVISYVTTDGYLQTAFQPWAVLLLFQWILISVAVSVNTDLSSCVWFFREVIKYSLLRLNYQHSVRPAKAFELFNHAAGNILVYTSNQNRKVAQNLRNPFLYRSFRCLMKMFFLHPYE